MPKILCRNKGKNGRNIFQIILFIPFLPSILQAENTLGCPDLIRSNKCSCSTFEDGVFLDCYDTTIKDVKFALRSVSNVASLFVYDVDENEDTLGPHFIPHGLCIKRIHIARTNIIEIADDALMPLRKCLETLSIVSSKMKHIPQQALSGMLKLISIDLTSNSLQEIPSYSFYGLPLMKLNLVGNMIHDISDSAFSSLELTLVEIDLSENNLTTFPFSSIAKLRNLRTLKLEWNEIYFFPGTENSDLISLELLNLNSNNFEFLSEDCLKFCPSLKKLSFHFNFINTIHYRAFYSLIKLESIDLSRNRIKFLNQNLFQNNKKLEVINLSFNHLHHIHGLFCNLPSLTEVLLNHNNILDVPIDSFHNSSKINAINLDMNCISNIHSESFSNLEHLDKIQLEFNYISKVPHDIFTNNNKLTIIRLDNNNLADLHNSTLWPLEFAIVVRLNNNKLKFISNSHFMKTLKVEEIYLDHNRITFIEPGAFLKLSNLRYLYLQNNNLIDINDILPRLNSNLIYLNLDSNAITLISSFMFQPQEKLHHLNLKNNRIKFLTKTTFRNLSYLAELELNNNEFSIVEDFSFQNLESARSLDLQYNLLRNITNYTFYGLGELEDLDVSHNKIKYVSDRAFDTLRKLRSLNLSFNPLKSLQSQVFQRGLPLSSLFLDNCEIQFIENATFKGLNNLKTLSIKNNSLKSEDLFSLDIPGLKHLHLSFNVLDYLPLECFLQLPLLETLYLEHCNIEHIFEGTFMFNKNLKKINLAQNIISTSPLKLFDIYNSISILNISNNFLDFIPYNTFHNLTHIESLDLSDNLLPKIELSGFEKLFKLKYLILKKNEIKSLTARKRVAYNDLILFDVSYNKLDSLPIFIFDIFPNIRHLNVSFNDIVNFDFMFTPKKVTVSLVNIDISKNPVLNWNFSKKVDENNVNISNLYELHISNTNMTNLENISFDPFVNLQNLYLKFNKIRRLSISPFSKLSSLENLDLSHNKIWQLKTSNFRGLSNLRTLCLANNNIESLESFTEELDSLKLLDLSFNKIQNILNEDLANLKELTVLYLAHNNIKYISVTAFRNLNKVIQIDLGQNKLQTVPIELLNSVETHIQEISIRDNVLICSCQKNNTWVWIQDHPRIINPETVTCLNDEYPKEKCSVPVISQLSLDKHKDNSISVSWFIRNRTAIKALQILYYSEDANSEVKSKYLEANEVSIHIKDLYQNSNYVVCVITLYEDPVIEDEEYSRQNTTNNSTIYSEDIVAAILMRSPSSECVSFHTFKKPLSVKIKPKKVFDISQILNRRMGLIVGCSLGFVVFFIMVSVLLYTKIKERKRIAKSDPTWSEMNDYHSVHSKDDVLENPNVASSTDNILSGASGGRTLSIDR